jgi:hypothetical protein
MPDPPDPIDYPGVVEQLQRENEHLREKLMHVKYASIFRIERELLMQQVKEWVINGISVLAFFLLLKALVSYVPDSGFPGAFKKVIAGV